MTEFLVGLVVGALALVPTVLSFRSQRDKVQVWYDDCATTNQRLMEENHSLHLQAAAPTIQEKVGIAALLDRPEPTPEVAGRWLYDDSGLVQTFVPDAD